MTKHLILIGVIVVLVCGGSFLTLPVQAGPELPPRDPPPTQPPPAADDDDDDDGGDGRPVGAYIELQAPAGAWVVVQWQDSAGGWHDVEGWRGAVAGSSRWWVHPKDFGSGPFRWVVFELGGATGAVSSSFNLPGQPNETLRVEAFK